MLRILHTSRPRHSQHHARTNAGVADPFMHCYAAFSYSTEQLQLFAQPQYSCSYSTMQSTVRRAASVQLQIRTQQLAQLQFAHAVKLLAAAGPVTNNCSPLTNNRPPEPKSSHRAATSCTKDRSSHHQKIIRLHTRTHKGKRKKVR